MTRLAIITGAGSGIGRELSREFCRGGVEVLGVGRRPRALEETAAAIRSEGLRGFTCLSADVSTVAGRQAVKSALPVGADIHYLALLAGIFPIGRLEDVDLASWRQTFAIHVEARLFLTQMLLDRLANGSRILFAKSGGAEKPRLGCIEVCASAAASLMVQKCMANELRERGILVSTTKPGFISTEMMAGALEATPEAMPDVEALRATPMISPATCASYLHWLFTGTADGDFIRDTWNIEDPAHHPHWLGGRSLHEAVA